MSPDSAPIAAESPEKSQLDSAPQSSTSTTLERSSLESLPDEVLIDIIRNCEPENTTSMARNLCLVSKRMEPVARQELYRAISILTYRSLRSLCRVLEQKPELGQYMVELSLLVPSDLPAPSNRKLTMMLVGPGQSSRSTLSPYHRFIHRLSKAITRLQQSGSIIAVLPRLEQVRLISDAHLQHGWNRAMVHPVLFKPFLRLSSLSSLECIEDSGAWGTLNPSVQPTGSPKNAPVNAHRYEQIKSLVLRESDSSPTDIMDFVNMFPVLEVLFIRNRGRASRSSLDRAEAASNMQREADQFEKRYLSDRFEKLQNLNTLVLIPHGNNPELADLARCFLGPSKFLSLKKLCNLTSISVVIDVFASPDGSITGPLTVSPIEALPRSLRSFQIIVDDRSVNDFRSRIPPNEARFQPRVAALEFMEELTSICSTEFPSLRQVEYIWAVTRRTDLPRSQVWNDSWTILSPEYGVTLENMQLCDGSVPLCCPTHTAIQSLSPVMDYTSKAEGIVSPFKDRFDSLELAFKNVGVTFEVIELKDLDGFLINFVLGSQSMI